MKRIKSKLLLLILFASASFVNGQTAKVAVKPTVKTDGIYECKDFELINGQADNQAPAYYRFFPDGSMLFCHYENTSGLKKDSMLTAEQVYQTVLTSATLDKIKENMTDDPANVYRTINGLKITAYKVQMLPNGICFDILSEKPNCLGKPNMKVPESTLLKTDNGVPADDRYFKFVQVN